MRILVTGAAGFIGFHLCQKLINEGHQVIGLDNINDYYDVNLKYARLNELGVAEGDITWNKRTNSSKFEHFVFYRCNLEDRDIIASVFQENQFDKVVNLAAQAGVRYSIENPYAYLNSNLAGFINILEGCRHNGVKHLVFASSSSVYGLNENMPFSTHHNVDHPISLYAATKKSNELMAHTYSNLYGIPATGLRFFTVYGPWGRPDMALFKFVKAILNGKPIDVYNNGELARDFTYIDDIIEGVYLTINKIPEPDSQWNARLPDPATSVAPYKIYNIGRNEPVHLMDFINAIEDAVGRKAQKHFMPMQPGDVYKTWADVSELMNDFNYSPATSVQSGVQNFVDWYREFYNV